MSRGFRMEVNLEDGKYTVIFDQNETGVTFECLRYGEKWRDLLGDNLVYNMLVEIMRLKESLIKDDIADKEASPTETVKQESCIYCDEIDPRLLDCVNECNIVYSPIEGKFRKISSDKSISSLIDWKHCPNCSRKLISRSCIYFRSPDLCACNNEPDNYGECIYTDGIPPAHTSTSIIACPRYKIEE